MFTKVLWALHIHVELTKQKHSPFAGQDLDRPFGAGSEWLLAQCRGYSYDLSFDGLRHVGQWLKHQNRSRFWGVCSVGHLGFGR